MNEAVEFVKPTLELIAKKQAKVVARNRHKIPFTTDDNHHFIDQYLVAPFQWTNGFWGGELWQLFALTGDPIYREAAIEVEQQLDANLMDAAHLTHDNGFKWSLTAVAHYRQDKDPNAENRAMLAAENLAGRFNLSGRFIRAWNQFPESQDDCTGWAIIDCLMNLPLLYWATNTAHDPRFEQIAHAHARTMLANIIRTDGSVKHIIAFDPKSGSYLKSFGGQGYGHGSSWTRGQAWAIYGFALSYGATKDQDLLTAAIKISNYFIKNIPASGLIPVDFKAPAEPWIEDASAAAIAASGFLELAKYVDDSQADEYRQVALRLLHALVEHDADFDPDHDELIKHCSSKYHEDVHEYPIIYGDYYFIEALMKLDGSALNLW